MNLFSYLYYFESTKNIKQLDDNVFYINNITLDEWETLEKTIKYDFLNFEDLRKKMDYRLLDQIKSTNNFLITKEGIVDLNEFEHSNPWIYYSYVDKEVKGLVLLKTKTQKTKFKKYVTISDLKSKDISLFVTNINKDIIITCYDNKASKKDFNYILFTITINKFIRPYNAGLIDVIAAQTYLDGQNIAYPIGAYFVKGNKIAPHREIVSRGARRAWYNYFTQKNRIILPFSPIDDENNPFTKTKIDDNEVHKKLELNDKNIEIIDDLEKHNVNDVNILKILKKGDYLDWVYILNKSFISEIKSTVNFLIKNHESEYQGFKNMKEKERKILEDANTFFLIKGMR
jgi:hypothetical protein